MAQNSHAPDLNWLLFSLSTVVCWGLYGLLLHRDRKSVV